LYVSEHSRRAAARPFRLREQPSGAQHAIAGDAWRVVEPEDAQDGAGGIRQPRTTDAAPNHLNKNTSHEISTDR
jgi:hypothetical protein